MFPESLQNELNIRHFAFNPVPKTDIKRLLSAIAGNENELDIPRDVITSLSESCAGDIRTAVNTLQFTFSAPAKTDKSVPQPRRKRSTGGMLALVLHFLTHGGADDRCYLIGWSRSCIMYVCDIRFMHCIYCLHCFGSMCKVPYFSILT